MGIVIGVGQYHDIDFRHIGCRSSDEIKSEPIGQIQVNNEHLEFKLRHQCIGFPVGRRRTDFMNISQTADCALQSQTNIRIVFNENHFDLLILCHGCLIKHLWVM